MEHAPLRPVPARPAGPLDPAPAARALAEALPELDAREAGALTLVALAGRPRAEAAAELGIGPGELAEALAAGRKALRRSLRPLTASGWCERAERLISDRLDGELDERAAARLDVHLRNCPRCVEHERRLVQATDTLVTEAAAGTPPEQPPVDLVDGSGVMLSVVTPSAARVEADDTPAEPAASPAPVRSGRQVASGAAWTLLVVVAVILALASLALVVAGVLGASL